MKRRCLFDTDTCVRFELHLLTLDSSKFLSILRRQPMKFRHIPLLSHLSTTTTMEENLKSTRSENMEQANGLPARHVLSPSKITDYFSSQTDQTNDPKISKESSDTDTAKSSSVYLTPESSPFKDQQDDVTQNQVISDSGSENKTSIPVDCCKETSASKSVPEPVKTKIESIPDKVSETDRSIINGHVQDQTVLLDTSKRKSNPPRVCQRTGNTKSVEDGPCVASPSLPRPKVRKNSKPKSAMGDSQMNSVPQSAAAKPKSGRKKKINEPVQTTAITDYFPVRRSGRQTKSQIEKESQLLVEKLIKSKYEEGLEVKEFEDKGRGVMATKVFDKGDFVVEYAGDLVDIGTAKDREMKYTLMPSVGCYMYFFNHRNKQYCVDATRESGRLGRLINHSRDGNCNTKVVMLDGIPHLILVAARHIKKGEELSYDYGDRSKASLEAHPWLKL